ncbi:MAG: pyridoxal-dependent decarboxylase [Actinomycetota bacterium]|nr:pyridoxal-dependent decarboxylase [Actinomycetota bacterium]
MTPEEFRAYGHQLIDWIADYRAGLVDLPVLAQVQPGEVAARLPDSAPESGDGGRSLIADLDEIVVPGLSLWQHPRFFNFFPANSELSSVLGDIASAGLGVIGLSWESSPALSEIEQRVTDWARQLFGLSDEWRGVIQDTASTSTLLALIEAREHASQFSMAGGGMAALDRPLVAYMSHSAHSSVPKAALLAGFGADHIRWIDTDEVFAMRPEVLARAIIEDRAAGCIPAVVVATCGTTTTTAVDPLATIGAIAREEGLWFHVDAAMAGSAMILPEIRHLWDGVELADSLVINAHKWLGVAFDCTLYYVKDPAHLERVMSTLPSYLRSAHDDEVTNLRDWGIPLGRRFRALKLWFMLKVEGAAALRARLRRDLENAQWLAAQVEAEPRWRVLAPVHLQTVCVRHEPVGVDGTELTGEELDRHTREWAERVNASGRAWVSLSTLEGRWMVRISIGALETEREHVEDLWREIRVAAG